VSIGISGSVTRSAAARARSIASASVPRRVGLQHGGHQLPLRMLAGDDLHLREQLRQRFGVEAVAALATVHADSGERSAVGTIDAGGGEDLVDDDSGLVGHLGGVDADAGFCDGGLDRVRFEELGPQRPQTVRVR
jgi:hypothetical protein